jgi:hypothetical protein
MSYPADETGSANRRFFAILYAKLFSRLFWASDKKWDDNEETELHKLTSEIASEILSSPRGELTEHLEFLYGFLWGLPLPKNFPKAPSSRQRFDPNEKYRKKDPRKIYRGARLSASNGYPTSIDWKDRFPELWDIRLHHLHHFLVVDMDWFIQVWELSY